MKQRNSKMRVNRSKGLQRGYSLLEVLIAMIVLAVGMLGIAGLQLLSVKNTHSAYYRSQATLLAYDIIDNIRANPNKISSYEIDLGDMPSGSYSTCVGTGASCSTDDMAKYDLFQWKCTIGKWAGVAPCNSSDLIGIVGLLPGGDGSVVREGNDVRVTVQWIDKDEREQATTAAEKIVSLQITTRIQ
jgi:type IV pilus assembly protein PilV